LTERYYMRTGFARTDPTEPNYAADEGGFGSSSSLPEGRDLVKEQLLKDMLEHPDDDFPRYAYADWLEEKGDPRGEFIHVQCQLEGLRRSGVSESDTKFQALQAQEHELLNKHFEEWAGSFAQYGRENVGFRRGFLDSLDLSFNNIGGAGARALAASPTLAGLTTLILSGNGIGPAGARALAASPNLSGLTTLNLSGNGIGDGDGGAEALAASERLTRLTALDLSWNDIGDAGEQALRARFGDRVHL
jgi:uncharacterized protein (TIGR02996 family)